MLTIILTNLLSLAFVVAPAIADDDPHEVLNVDDLTQPDPIKSPENSQRNTSKDSLTLQEKLGEKNSASRPSSEGRWNLNETNDWKDFAYINGNKTRLVVGLQNLEPTTYTDLENLATKNSGEIVNTVSINKETIAVVVEIPLNAMSSFETDVRAAGLASYIEPNMKFETKLVPNDPYWSWQWGPQKIQAEWAWDIMIGDPSVLVAVVDTGIDWDHPDLAANYAPLGYDWVNNDTDSMDDHGHGTHCAGIIAAVLNNGIGIAGLAQVRIMAEKGLDRWGEGYEDWLANAIIHAVDQGANIISMSWGGYFHSELIYQAIRYAYDTGVLLVAAAGNEATNVKSFPAGYDEVIAVVATDQYDGRPGWTNYGDWIELAAPGVDIYSTVWNDGYMYASGTSMACPHVAGVAALVWSQFPGKTRDWVRLWLQYTADDLGSPGFDIYYGYGRINARRAVEQVSPDHELIILSWETPPYLKPSHSGIINATILNFGENNEINVTAQLLANDTVVDSTSIGFLVSGASTTISCVWNPMVEGRYNVTLYLVPVPGETNLENNIVWKYIYVGSPVKAIVLDSAGTDIGDVIATWQVLNVNWYLFGSTMVYIDYATLNKENISYEDIAATDADVLIISCASSSEMGWQFTDSEIEAIKRYVLEGHGLIGTAGTLYYYVPNNNKLASLFGLSETITWYATETDLLHIEEPDHPLFVKVPNPLVFSRIGTNIPSDGVWDANELVDGKYVALGHFKESAIVVRRGLVYLSPLFEIIPAYYHYHLQLLYNAITWSRYQKPEHELVVSLETPARLEPGESALLNAMVSNLGRSNETDVELQILIDGILVASVTIDELFVDSCYTLSYLWTPTVQGLYNVTAYAPPLPGEEFTENNIAEKKVMVLLIVVRNVLVYADDFFVSPSSRYVIVALNNLGINYTYYADDPSGFGVALVSQPWDLVIVDHYNYYAVGYLWTELEEYVRNGGFLVLSTFDIDGSHSEPTTLWDTLGVRWVSNMQESPEPVYRWTPSHPIFTFPNTVGDITSYVNWGPVDYGDHVAATTGTPIAGFTTTPTEDYAAIVVGNIYPTVLFSFCLDDFRYDEDGDGRLDAVELWENAVAYITKPLEHDIAVSLEAPKALKPGQSTLLNATVSNKGLSNETEVELQIFINNTMVESTTILELLVGDSYTLSYLWTPTAEGMYNVTAYAPPLPDEGNIRNNMKSAKVMVSTLVVALFKNVDPWDHPSNEEVLNLYGIPHVVLSSRDFGTVDLSAFTKVVIASDQDQAFYNGMDTYRWWFEDYVSNGGVLETHAAHQGWHGGSWIGQLPGGLLWVNYYADYVSIVDSTHPVVTTPNLITDAELDRWSASVHGYFSTYPEEVHVIIIEDSTRMPAYLEFSYGSGFIIASSQTLEWAYKWRYSRILENSLLYMPIKHLHDLAVSLEAPTLLARREPALLNATVHNRGLSNETDVGLLLLINNTIVSSATIPELLVGDSYTLNYLWTPTIGGAYYNITAYAPPVLGEDFTRNNHMTKIAYVSMYARTYTPHQWVGGGTPMGWHTDDASWSYTLPFDFPFYGVHYRTIYISSNGLITFIDPDSSCSNSIPALAGKLAIAPAWDDWVTYEPYDIFIWQNSTHVGIRWWVAAYYDRSVTANFEAILGDDGVIQFNYEHNNGPISATIGISNSAGDILAEDLTSLNYIHTIVFTPYEHELIVYLDAPTCLELDHSALLNATVQNRGLNNETNVELYLLINDTIVNYVIIPELLVRQSITLSYMWTPNQTGNYNITAYSPPVIGEEYPTNNIQTKSSRVWFYWRLYLPHEWVGGGVPMGWNADDDCWQYTLPFDFPFYCNSYRTIYISSNGLITFIDPDASYDNSIPALSGKLAIAPAWDDWVTYSPHDIYIWENATHVGIRWYVAAHYDRNIVANFEVILRVDGVIQFNYDYNNGPISSTTGISNGAGHTLARDLSSLNYIRTIVFAQFPLKNDVAIVSVVPSAHEVLVGDTVDVAVVAENQGNATESFIVTAYASPLNSTKIYLDPSNYLFDASTTEVGTLFNVTVKVEDVTDLTLFQICIIYNDIIINVTRWYEPTWDPEYVFYDRTTFAPSLGYWHIDPDQGVVGVGSCLLGPDGGFTGSGTLCILEFKITAVPPEGETYSCTLNIDNPDTFLFDTSDEIPGVTKENGYYEISFGPLPPPTPPGVYRIGTITVENLAPDARITLTFTWDTTDVILKDYSIWAHASPVQGETDIADNTYINGIIRIEKPPFASFIYSPPFPKAGETITLNATGSTPDGGIIISYSWNFSDGNVTATEDPIITHVYTFSGVYNVTLTITDSAGLTDSTWKTIYVMTRDIAVVDVTPSTDRAYVERTITINVTITNKGEVNETFDVILYYNVTVGDTIGAQTVRDLLPGEHITLTFLWNTTGIKPCHDYEITAYAVPVYGETNTADNTLSSPTRVKIRILGDINGDGKVDMKDVYEIAKAFWAYPEHPRWNTDADLNNDGKIDMKDVYVLAKNFLKTCL